MKTLRENKNKKYEEKRNKEERRRREGRRLRNGGVSDRRQNVGNKSRICKPPAE